TQIYLTEAEQRALRSLASKRKKAQSELIRQAVDEFISRSQRGHRQALRERVFGIWKNRADVPDVRAMRRAWRGR
ncbi:MAG TPA: ribbon-helix-helix protein, CopG family, partial [Candidatus Baltobacteraceae bacterium]|nr:ribbon-helix-helix protein, CopG family [Candidatus Baltobacteraceae bacterium]